MKIDLTDLIWLDEQHEISLAELADISGLTERELHELVENGVLVPCDSSKVPWTFSSTYIVTTQKACRLRNDFDLDLNALALTLMFLDRIHKLEAQLRELQIQQPPKPTV
jgi:hypothetical protein